MTIRLTNTRERYGWVSILLHWVMAAMIVGLFFLGDYMTDLEYTHPMYHQGPHIHESFGLIVLALLLVRTVWIVVNKKPDLLPMPRWERIVALTVHKLFYFLLFAITISGYLIPTADGSSIELFNWFELPAVISGIDHQEDIAGDVHYLFAYGIIFLMVLHILASLKHHFIEKDKTLLRMLGLN